MLQWTQMHKYVFEILFSIFLEAYTEARLLDYIYGNSILIFKENVTLFSIGTSVKQIRLNY